MSIPVWPASLPQRLLIKSYSESPADVLLRTSMDFGPAKVRRRGTAGPRPVSGSIIVTAAELATFKTFFNTTLLGGSLRFRWRDPIISGQTMLVNTVSGASGIVETSDGMAFVDSGTDIAEYDGCKAIVTDSASKTAVGYIHHDTSDDPFVQMTYASSGSSGIRVADNDNIDFGTGNFTLVWKGALPDWTPSPPGVRLIKKRNGGGCYDFYISADGKIGIYNGAVSYMVDNPALTDGTIHEITAVVTRETASVSGSMVLYIDGSLHRTVTIPAGVPASWSNNASLETLGYIIGKRHAGTVSKVITYNRALTAAEVLSLYQNGVAEADKWGSQTALNVSSCVNQSYDTFDGASSTGFHAAYTGTGTQRAITHDEIPYVLGKRYSVSFNATLTSGRAPIVYPLACVGGTSVGATAQTIVAGANLLEFTATTTTTGVVQFYNTAAAEYTIDSLAVRQLGATLALEPEGINTTNWTDSSDNGLDASYPATGYSIYPDGTGVRIASTANGSAYNFSSIEDGFRASGVHTIKIYDYLEMRFTKTPSWQALSGDLFEIALELEILP